MRQKGEMRRRQFRNAAESAVDGDAEQPMVKKSDGLANDGDAAPAIAPTRTATPISANSLRRTIARRRAGRLSDPRSEVSVGAAESIDNTPDRVDGRPLTWNASEADTASLRSSRRRGRIASASPGAMTRHLRRKCDAPAAADRDSAQISNREPRSASVSNL